VAEVPQRYIVELRPPRKGERFLFLDDVEVADRDWGHDACWVIVDPVPEDALQRLREAIRTSHLDNERDLLAGYVPPVDPVPANPTPTGYFLSDAQLDALFEFGDDLEWADRRILLAWLEAIPGFFTLTPVAEATTDSAVPVCPVEPRTGVEGTETTKEPK
jgi:hypothetical protein